MQWKTLQGKNYYLRHIAETKGSSCKSNKKKFRLQLEMKATYSSKKKYMSTVATVAEASQFKTLNK
jgi:hypothetical protein